MDEAEWGAPVLHPRVEARDEPLADLSVLGGDAVGVALEERREQLRHQGLGQGVGLVKPRSRGELRIAEHRRVEPRELVHRQPGLIDARTRDLVALLRRSRILEQQREPPAVGVEDRHVAPRERSAEPRCKLAIEADLTLVDAEPDARRATRLVRRGDLQDDTVRRAVIVRVVDCDAVVAAHLPGADLLGPERVDRARRERILQPCGRNLVGGPQHLHFGPHRPGAYSARRSSCRELRAPDERRAP